MIDAPATAGPGARSSSRRTRSASGPRRAALAAVVVVVAAGGGALALMGPGTAEEAPVFVTSTRLIHYEVSGPGAAESIQYVVGAGNRAVEVAAPTLPWRVSVPLEVGPGGGSIQVLAANAGVAPLTCLIKVDDQVVFTATGLQETDVACSSSIAPATR